MPDYEPLRITARLQTPVICDDRLPLDGIFLYFLAREGIGFQPSTGVTVSPFTSWLRMPLKKAWRTVRGRDYWFYACSFARWVGTVAEGRDYWAKRFDVKQSDIVDFKGRRGKVITANGKYKGYRMPVFTRHALAVRWYAVGNKKEIERLLNFCTHLGKKESQGYGAVLDWTVESWHSDWSIESPRGLMRAVPSEQGLLVGFRPSYWSPENQTTCVLPESYGDIE